MCNQKKKKNDCTENRHRNTQRVREKAEKLGDQNLMEEFLLFIVKMVYIGFGFSFGMKYKPMSERSVFILFEYWEIKRIINYMKTNKKLMRWFFDSIEIKVMCECLCRACNIRHWKSIFPKKLFLLFFLLFFLFCLCPRVQSTICI